jgi:hypothetical protein
MDWKARAPYLKDDDRWLFWKVCSDGWGKISQARQVPRDLPTQFRNFSTGAVEKPVEKRLLKVTSR